MQSANSFLESAACRRWHRPEAGARRASCQSSRVADQSRASATTRRSYISNIAVAAVEPVLQVRCDHRPCSIFTRVMMACNSVSSLNSVSAAAADRRCETGSGIPSRRYSASSSPDGFQPELDTTRAAPAKALRHSGILESRAGTQLTPTSALYAGGRTYASLPGSWYAPTSDCYAGYPVQAGSRPPTTCSGVTWSTDDVKPTSFVLPLSPIECHANCRQNYCKEQ